MTPAADSVTVADMSFAYPDGHVALRNVEMYVEPGERVAVLGPNGSGKTTLMLHLNGVLRPTAGTVHVGDLAVVEANFREIRRRVGIVFQDPDDQLFMPTVRQDVAFGPANLGHRGATLDARVQVALDEVGMASGHRTISAWGNDDGSHWRPSCRWNHRCWSSTSHPQISIPWLAANWPTSFADSSSPRSS